MMNGRIKYKGDFINGKMGGNGQYYFENGDYYIGQMKNDLIDGYGKIYYMNGSIKYDGNFVNGHRHDKGIRNDMDGNIKYDGNFVNDKKEGNWLTFSDRDLDIYNILKLIIIIKS